MDMTKADSKILEVKVMKNALEQYVYDNRAYLDTYADWAKFADDQTRE